MPYSHKSDLELDPMTLVLKLDLDMVKMYQYTKNEVSMSRHSKVIAQTDRQTDTHTDRQYENITFPHSRPVKRIVLSYSVTEVTSYGEPTVCR